MKKLLCILLILCLVLTVIPGCDKDPGEKQTEPAGDSAPGKPAAAAPTDSGNAGSTAPADPADGSGAFGSSLDELNAYAGYFEGDSTDITVDCVSGTSGCYTLNGNVLTFTNVKEDSVYA